MEGRRGSPICPQAIREGPRGASTDRPGRLRARVDAHRATRMTIAPGRDTLDVALRVAARPTAGFRGLRLPADLDPDRLLDDVGRIQGAQFIVTEGV